MITDRSHDPECESRSNWERFDGEWYCVNCGGRMSVVTIKDLLNFALWYGEELTGDLPTEEDALSCISEWREWRSNR